MSEVVRSMNISAGSSIRTGSVNISGSSSTTDELKFAESDLDAVVAVKVVNQCHTVSDTVTFTEPEENEMTMARFHEVYGDCFISGFIEGGDLHGIISIKTLDHTRRSEIKTAVRSQLNSSPRDWSPQPQSSSSDKIMESAEVTVNVNWSGGGYINPTGTEWTLSSLVRAASVFPKQVAQCPQRTWAILSRYDTIPNFIDYAKKHDIAIRRYNGVQTFAGDLLDMHMEFKTNVQMLTHAMGHLDQYNPSQEKDAVAVTVADLVTERRSLKKEMAKLAKVIEELDKDPSKVGYYEECLQIESPDVWRTRLPIRNKPQEAVNVDTAIRNVLDFLPVLREPPQSEPVKVEAPGPDFLEFALDQTVMLVNSVSGFALDMGTFSIEDIEDIEDYVHARGWVPDGRIPGQQLKLHREGSGKDAVWTIEWRGKFLGLKSQEELSPTLCSAREPYGDKRKLHEWIVEYLEDHQKFTFRNVLSDEYLYIDTTDTPLKKLQDFLDQAGIDLAKYNGQGDVTKWLAAYNKLGSDGYPSRDDVLRGSTTGAHESDYGKIMFDVKIVH